jgi:signal transduction histidine kinase
LAHWFAQMSEALARAEQLRRNMVSDIAHELRTPLSNIRGYMEGLRDGVIPPEPKLFDALHEQAMILNRLVGDLQELALVEAGQLHMAQQPARIQDIVLHAVNGLQAEASRHGVALAADIPHDLPLVYADSERVGQMLMNLLKNAIMYTPPGGHVIIQAHTTGDMVTVAVRDTGQGIPLDILPHVFERFYRVDRSRTRATGGSGLGLAIVKQLAQAQGGDVWAESTPGRGSTFAFTLPRA